jgi:phosphoribosyl 1,2-cyclic phosphate phosphodiesterase
MRFTVLGSGTSTGVPSVACQCPTCLSDSPKNKRLRSSLLVQSNQATVVIDSSLDFRQQMLRYNVQSLEGIVYTHHHFDHIGGFDDTRPYAFASGKPLSIFGLAETIRCLEATFPYAFGIVESTGASVPNVLCNEIGELPFTIGDISFVPIPMFHGATLRVNGYRIGNMAYCTDVNHIPESSLERLHGLTTLIIDGLRYEPHPTHFTITEALEVINQLQPKQAYLTHIAHQVEHHAVQATLPRNVALAYDGLVVLD